MLWPLSVQAQSPFFRKINLPGVSSTIRIHTLHQDPRNIVWIGTSEGVFRFNGLNFEAFTLPSSLLNHKITAITSSVDNELIMGTSAGQLFKVVNDKVTIILPDTFIINVPISAIKSYGLNQFWFSTLGQGIFRMDNDKVTRFSYTNGIGDDYVYDLLLDDSGQVWVGSDGGLSYSEITNKQVVFHNLNSNNGLPDNIVRKLINGPGTSLGIGMEENGFCLYNYSDSEFIHPEYFQNFKNESVSALVLLENEFWIGTLKSGIIDFEFKGKKRVRQIPFQEDIFTAEISCMLKDHEDNVWIGSGNELFFSPGEKFEFKKTIFGNNLGSIRSILNDSKGFTWFSNESGLFRYKTGADDRASLTQPLKGTKFNNFTIITLYEDIFGFIWMGTFDNGVLRYDPINDKCLAFNESHGLINMNVLSIDGTNEEIWFATLGGVSKCILNDSSLSGVNSFESFSEENGLGNNFIYTVFIDSKKRVWFGTDGKGITCYTNNTFLNYNESQGLKSKVIYSITEDNNGHIWMSSANEGLAMYDGKAFRNFTIEDGLSDLSISALTINKHGHLVIIHKKGIDILDPENFQFVSYGSESGLSEIDPDLNVVDINDDGSVWLGVNNGIIRLAFDNASNLMVPDITIDNVFCFLEKIDTSSVHQFSYDRNHLSFSFFSVWYTDPLRVIYQYRLNGYNNDWIVTRDRFVTYPNLPPGNYTFSVRSSINGNFKNSKPVSYSFVISQPLWKRSWFIILASSILFVLFYLYLKYRDAKIKSVEMLNRERIESQFEILKNQVNPHFLFNSFNTLISVIENDKEVAVDYVNKLSDFFRSILSYHERDLISLSEELKLVEDYIFLQQKRHGGNFNVTISVSDEIRNNYLIPPLSLQILIENCLKHNAVSSESPLTIELNTESDSYLVVKNKVIPTYIKEPSTGIGLHNLRIRYRIITGEEIVISEMDGYFAVKLPLIKTTNITL